MKLQIRWQYHPYRRFRNGPNGHASPPAFPYRYYWWCPQHSTGESDLTWANATLHARWHLAVPHN